MLAHQHPPDRDYQSLLIICSSAKTQQHLPFYEDLLMQFALINVPLHVYNIHLFSGGQRDVSTPSVCKLKRKGYSLVCCDQCDQYDMSWFNIQKGPIIKHSDLQSITDPRTITWSY
jgi:hypothetical protein